MASESAARRIAKHYMLDATEIPVIMKLIEGENTFYPPRDQRFYMNAYSDDTSFANVTSLQHQQLGKALIGHWKEIGAYLGLKQYEIKMAERANNPGESMLSKWSQRGNSTILTLYNAMAEINKEWAQQWFGQRPQMK